MKWGVLLLCPASLLAHMVSMSTGELRIDGNHAHYELRMPAYAAAHVQHPESALLGHLRFGSGGVAARLVRSTCGARDGTYTCAADYEFAQAVENVDIDCTLASITVPNHVHVLRAFKGDKSDEAVFDLSFTSARILFRPPTPLEIAVQESSAGFLRAIGGPAPLLFLASLVLASRSRRELAILTASLVTGEAVACWAAPRLPIALTPRFIEAAAALTIAYLAFEIVLLPTSGQRWLVVGMLGLIHGAYFSLFLTSSRFHLWTFWAGVILAELLVVTALAFAGQRLLSAILIPRAVPALASVLLAASLAWFAWGVL